MAATIMVDETNDIAGRAAGSNPGTPGATPSQKNLHSPEDNVQILEEHVIAPPHQTSPAPSITIDAAPPLPQFQATPVVPPIQKPEPEPFERVIPTSPTMSPQRIPPPPPPQPHDAPTQEADDAIKNILEKIKLPERKQEPTPPQSQAFDTTLSIDPKSEVHQQAAAQARATARTMSENLQPNNVSRDIPALHTLRDDLQYVVRDKKISLVRAVALEEEKRHQGTALEEHIEGEVRRSTYNRFGLFIAGILILVGALALLAVYLVSQERTSNSSVVSTTQLLFAEQTVPLTTNGLSPADIRREIARARAAGTLTLGAILQIVPVTENADTSLEPLSFGSFLEKIGARAPEGLARALENEFFFGIHTVDENAPLFVIPVVSYERAFAGMLAWEKTMNADLAPMFSSLPAQVIDENGLPRERVFEDAVMRNYDVRVLRDDTGQIQLYYSFPTRNILIIAESPYSFTEILTRLRADRRL